jgi:hypothetical protein
MGAPRFHADCFESVVGTAGVSSMPCFLSDRPRHGKRVALSLLRAGPRRTFLRNSPHGENSEANYSPEHKKGFSKPVVERREPRVINSAPVMSTPGLGRRERRETLVNSSLSCFPNAI